MGVVYSGSDLDGIRTKTGARRPDNGESGLPNFGGGRIRGYAAIGAVRVLRHPTTFCIATFTICQMPPASRRTGRTQALLKAYVRNSKGRQRRALLHRRAAARIRQEDARELTGTSINPD
ncbi:hypothetical protein B0H19DRAFT_1066122 [Mycena capillaripes]|nr:hypothetical protein B0H19DRAFT_1066122 [Mycena capillaripes]